MSDESTKKELVKVRVDNNKINLSSPLTVNMKGSYYLTGINIIKNDELTPKEKAEKLLHLLKSMDYVMARMGISIMKELEEHVDFQDWINNQAKDYMRERMEDMFRLDTED